MKRLILLLVLGAAALLGLWILMKPAPTPAPIAAHVPAATPDAVAPPAEIAQPVKFEIAVQHGARVAGPEVLQVNVGDEVSLSIVSDHDDTLHLHGYDLHAPLRAGQPTLLKFKAIHSGRFEYELHHAHLELGTLEVLPQ